MPRRQRSLGRQSLASSRRVNSAARQVSAMVLNNNGEDDVRPAIGELEMGYQTTVVSSASLFFATGFLFPPKCDGSRLSRHEKSTLSRFNSTRFLSLRALERRLFGRGRYVRPGAFWRVRLRFEPDWRERGKRAGGESLSFAALHSRRPTARDSDDVTVSRSVERVGQSGNGTIKGLASFASRVIP